MAVEHRSREAESKLDPSALGPTGPPTSREAQIPRQGDEPPVTSGRTSASRQPTALLFTLRLPGSEGGWTGPLTPGERTPRNSGDRVLANRNPLLLFRLDGGVKNVTVNLDPCAPNPIYPCTRTIKDTLGFRIPTCLGLRGNDNFQGLRSASRRPPLRMPGPHDAHSSEWGWRTVWT